MTMLHMYIDISLLLVVTSNLTDIDSSPEITISVILEEFKLNDWRNCCRLVKCESN